MTRHLKRWKWTIPVIVFLGGLGLVMVFLLMQRVQGLLTSDLGISLAEIATQHKNIVSARLQADFQDLGLAASRWASDVRQRVPSLKPDAVRADIARLGAEHNDARRFIADDRGIVTFADGSVLDVAGRAYFRESIRGLKNISSQPAENHPGDDSFVVSVPAQIGSRVIGTCQAVLSSGEIQEILAAPLFSGKGSALIVDRDGGLVAGGHSPSGNYFRDLLESGDQRAAGRLAQDFQRHRSGFIVTKQGGRRIYAAYTPIGHTEDWFLVASVPAEAVFPNGRSVVNLFYAILLLVTVVFALALAYFTWYQDRQQRRLRTLAFVDPVTQGHTYARFLDDARRLLAGRASSSHVIVKADVDNFKYINKFFGFEAGNQLLSRIHHRFARRMGADERVARIAGDNFVLLLADARPERLARLFSPMPYRDITVYFSAGVYTIESPGEDPALMIDKANIAAKRIKGLVHESVSYYTRALETESIHHETLKQKIRQGLDRHEFVPFYQPKIDIRTNRVIGCEALARWRTGEGRFMSPAEFIPVCEQTGMVLELDFVIYEQVLRFLRDCLDRNLPCVPVSVNFSRLHLLDRDLADELGRRAQALGIPAGLIEIELTENIFFDNFEQMVAITRRLHDHGFLISMDDFGTGYSSLKMLKNIPIDVLKIDKTFLEHSADESRRNVIFSGIVAIAKQLDLRVVVEGVETAEDIALMRDSGCRIAQGYFFSRPVLQESYLELIERHGVDACGYCGAPCARDAGALPGDALPEDVDRLADDDEQGDQEAGAQQDDARVPVAEPEADEHRDDPQDEEDQEQVAVKEHGGALDKD